MPTPIGYPERRAIKKAAPGSAGAQLRDLAEHVLDIGEFETFSRAWNAVRMRNPLLYQRYIDETSEGAEPEEPSMDVNDEILSKAHELAGGDPSKLTEAIMKVVADNPDLEARRAQFAREQSRTVAKARPEPRGDPGVIGPGGAPRQRQSLPSHPEELATVPDERRAPPARTQGHINVDNLLAEAKTAHPTWSEQQCWDAVLRSDAGKAAMAQHRQEVLSGKRG